MIKKTCANCGSVFFVYPVKKEQLCCSKPCARTLHKASDPENEIELLKKYFSYDPISGKLFNKTTRSYKGMAGDEAGWIQSQKGKKTQYRRIKIHSKTYAAHRAAWAIHYGEWPNQIDHIDGNGLNNKINNLRSVTNKENCKNRSLRSDNTSGVVGVYKDQNNKWVATIHKNNKKVVLYRGISFNDARAIRKEAEKKHGFHSNHGREL